MNSELRQLREFKSQHDKLVEQKENERIKALAEKGQLEDAWKQLNSNYERKLAEYANSAKQIEIEWLSERRNSAVAEVLAGRQFAGADPSATAAMVRRLLEGEVEAVRDAKGTPVIRDRTTLRPAAEYLKERLESPEFAVFFAATNRGGAGTDGARPAAATPKNGQVDPFADFANKFVERRASAQQARFLPKT